MVFRFTCFECLSIPTEIRTDEKAKSTYYSAQADFPETYKRPEGLRVFMYLELINITRNFDHISKIGEGEFGSVYEGPCHFLNQGILQVFIKRLKGTYVEGHKQWVKEVNVLGSIDHPNLVKLVGYCVEGNEKSGMQRFLVYEHMAGISLGERIFENPHRFYDKFMLGWSSRLKVAIDVARGLACLHEVMDNQVAFGDFKYSNVHVYHRVEGDTVKLSNFGLPHKGLKYLSTQDVSI
ncbi:probable receptor-like protein kinase isoform X2 [Tanacetum coccineum]|uniref:Probable receptor-like protein kinase isoform X2 n=1 Tax=Tanacetum coccineum TaxID=301880 RepID=A0ABQ5GF64_9ASTR